MRERLVQWLRCPDCGGVVALEPGARAVGADIVNGVLSCRGCMAAFPVVRGVPRLLPRALRTAAAGGQARVMAAFGFEWTEFAAYASDNFARWTEPLTAAAFAGRLVLDAGCGAGHHARTAHAHGAEVIAMDLSPAVDAAHRNGGGERLHVVQGDIFHPPLAPATFDTVYSLGVLHHTPDPPMAFQRLVPLLRPGGTMAVMLYASGRPLALGALAVLRVLTTHLPLPAVKRLAWLAAGLDTLGPITLYRGVDRLGLDGPLVRALTPGHVRRYARETFATCHADWLDRLSYPYVHYYSGEDVLAWFDAARLSPVSVRPLEEYGWVGVARSAGEAPAGRGAEAEAEAVR
jgi:SAM-dependent methyltransferase/uncharacterized protein YbaR (Trm112 family)